MIDTQEKPGFFANNSGWIWPLIIAFVLIVAPKMAEVFGGMNLGFLVPVCAVAAFFALVLAGIKARMADTTTAKIVSSLALLFCLFLVVVQFFQDV